MIVLGIDPGAGHTGWAVIKTDSRTIADIGTIRDAPYYPTGDALLTVAERYKPSFVAIQWPFKAEGKTPRFYIDPKTEKPRDRSGVSFAKLAAHTGWLYGYLAGRGYPVIPAVPKRGAGCKVPRREWELYWQWTGRTSQDARDAAQIALQAVKEGVE